MKESLKRIWKTGWLNFKRNSYLSLGTTGVMVLVLILFSALMGLNFLSVKIVSSLEEKVDITAYFKTEASEDEIARVKEDLHSLTEVSNVDYISRETALE